MTPRRTFLPTLTAGALATAVALAGCTGESQPPSPAPSTSPGGATSRPSEPAGPTINGVGIPAAVLATVRPIYGGGVVTAHAEVRNALARRKAPSGDVSLRGATGSWHGDPIAVVTSGRDTTLLTRSRSRWTVVGGWWPSLGVAGPVPGGTMHVLAIGSDARPGQNPERSRGDALQLIGTDARGIGGIVGLPRDTWVALSTGGYGKVNSALAYGGPKAEVATVRRATGVSLDGYVLTDMAGFMAMVDDLGGVLVVARESLTTTNGFRVLRPGRNLLTGYAALWMARERKTLSGGDFARSLNQGRLLRAGLGMAASGGTLKVPARLTAMSRHLRSDLSAAEILRLAALAARTAPDDVRIAVPRGTATTRAGQSVVVLDSSAAALFRDLEDGRLSR